MKSQPGQKTIAIHILPNISRSKGNQAMKLGQLIENNKRRWSAAQFQYILIYSLQLDIQ